jgi:hypothetical protein
MSPDTWPSPDSPPPALPRIEDLPIADHGYDQEAVRLAFDSFYRHAAQLDASLRALEAVEVFRRDADALRNDLRALRAMGLGGGAPEPAWATASYERGTPEVPGVVLRLAAEAALIVAVAVVAGVAQFRAVVIVILMALAFAIVAVSEWLAARARFVPPAVAFLPPLEDAGEPAPYVEAPPPVWGGQSALEPVEDTEPDALTVIESVPAEEDASVEEAPDGTEDGDEDGDEGAAEPALDPWEQTDDGDGAGAGDGPEPELAERAGIFRRRRR